MADPLPLIFRGAAWAQLQPNISQTTGRECSPAVVSQGTVTITCLGLDQRQQEILRKMPKLLEQLLRRNQADRTVQNRGDPSAQSLAKP